MKNVALVHYWLDSYRGGEKVLEALCELFPEADIFTNVYVPEKIPPTIRQHNIETTFIQKLPLARRFSRNYLPFMPLALEQLDLSGYDLVISSESGPAKGVITGPDTLHICYCHSPMRYLWDQYSLYKKKCSFFRKILMAPVFHYLRQWDVLSANRVDRFVANSHFVSRRIRKYYRRNAEVIHPPVEVDRFRWDGEPEDYYLTIAGLVPYKRIDLIVDAFNENGRPLIIIGGGSEKANLQKRSGDNIQFFGHVSDDILDEKIERCKALVYAGVEDFGIVPVEAQAAGRPVIAFGRGGVLDTVIDGKTGIFFQEQSVTSFNNAIEEFEANEDQFDRWQIRRQAESFSREIFMDKIKSFINQSMEIHRKGENGELPEEIKREYREN